MPGYPNKRKHKGSHPRRQPHESDAGTSEPPDQSLYIVAYEADITRGPAAWGYAPRLEVGINGLIEGAEKTGLLQWNPTGILEDGIEGSREGKNNEIWVDRYDARLLLDALPTFPPAGNGKVLASNAMDSDGWSDLPSDAEDTFFFSREETEDYHRDKRRRVIEQNREERMRAALQRDHDAGEEVAEEDWPSDEEPSPEQRDLMRRTASHILSSPNPAMLELRILANHGADGRIAFLKQKGRWKRAWRIAKASVKAEMKQKEEEDKGKTVTLGGLEGYGDSDSGGEQDEGSPSAVDDGGEASGAQASAKEQKIEAVEFATPEVKEMGAAALDEEALKQARRARAREWAAKRRALSGKDEEGTS